MGAIRVNGVDPEGDTCSTGLMKNLSADSRATRGTKREHVLAEAAKALNSHGLTQTSLAEIAQRVGVSRAALYYYFEDQQDLVFQSYRRSCEILARRLSEASRTRGDAMEVIEAFIDSMLEEEEAEFAALSEAAYLRPEQRSTILGLYAAIQSKIAGLLEDGARRGQLRPCAAGIVAQAIIGLISWIPMARRWRTNIPLSHTDMVDAIKSILRIGIAADRRTTVAYTPFDLSSAEVPMDRIFDAEVMAAAKQEALLASASWLFNLKGVDATSLEEIALRVGVTKKVIYHNVGDKETLVVQCYRRSFKFYESIAARTLNYAGPRISAISASTHAFSEASLREDIAPLAPLAGFESLPASAKEEIQNSAIRIMNNYLAIYEFGQAEGSVRSMNTRALLAVQPGIFEWLPKWFDIITPEDRTMIAAELAELNRIGLSPC